jgi:2-succinyl-6-hydroxy-2,4-cyclohexadiene-1-carboxylate synthase
MRLASTVAGSGPRVVLVHGFTQTGRSWRHVAPRLALNHEVIAVDTPGHGDSSSLATNLWTGAAALVEAAGTATYVGYSMGGRLALHAALAHPRSVTRLVLLGATPGIADPTERAARQHSDNALADDLEHRGVETLLTRWLANPMFARLPSDPLDMEDRRRNTTAGLASSLRLAGTGGQESLWDRLPELKMPVLVLAGERDAKFIDIGSRMAAAIGPNASFKLVPDANHAAHLEQPDHFLALVEPFLNDA